MTKKQIIEKLQNAAKPYEEYYIDEDLINAINQYPEPFELVEPILAVIGFKLEQVIFCIPFFQRYVFGSNMENGEVFIPN